MKISSPVLEEPFSAEDRQDIDEQMQRILRHPLFQQSKRLPMFLRYIVNEALTNGNEGSTKERTLGIEVFGRKADYDNNSDPIVRVTASELRKKLAQYYYEDGHSDEVRIELKPGSYLPSFRRSQIDATTIPPAVETASAIPQPGENSLDTHEDLPTQVFTIDTRTSPRRRWLNSKAVIFGFLMMAVVAYAGGRAWQRTHSPVTQFWSQLLQGSNHVYVVMPVIGSDDIQHPEAYVRNVSAKPALSLEDTNLIVQIANQLNAHQAHYQLVSSSEVSLAELRTGPSILIGALDNIWTMRLTKELPYVFAEAPNNRTGSIMDTTSADHESWNVNIDMPHTRINEDYGIVARFHNELTGEPILVIAGISSQGTQAAGELVTSPAFDEIRSVAGTRANFEVVIKTEAFDGHAGPPRIVAQKIW
jgi:hypothetical protein